MGTIRNEMTIIHDWDRDRIEKLRQDAIETFSKSIEYEDMISPIMTSYINEEYTFIINGECSKIGWEPSKRFHDIRMKWCEDHRDDAESIVVLNFGEDWPCYMVYDNNGEEEGMTISELREKRNNIINEAFLRANSINATWGLAIRSGHKHEAEELERAHMMIIKLIEYIEKMEEENG